jgi:predicted enzyme involved in methoxymalonyl-ACP biosynthesis
MMQDLNNDRRPDRYESMVRSNGLISIVLGHVTSTDLHLDLWLMSCQVLKRDMELAMLDGLAERAQQKNVRRLVVLSPDSRPL